MFSHSLAPWVVFAAVGLTAACSKKEGEPVAARPTPSSATPATPPASPPASQPASAPSSQPKPRATPNLEHPTDVTGLRQKTPCDGTKPCLCVGILEFGDTALAQIGITPAHLTEGTACVLGDFDGNGFMDVAFLGVEHGEVVENVPKKSEGRVLMFDGVGLRLVSVLPKEVVSLARREKVQVGDKTQDVLYDPEEPEIEMVLVGERFGLRKRLGQ